jgi:hypothetical protein
VEQLHCAVSLRFLSEGDGEREREVEQLHYAVSLRFRREGDGDSPTTAILLPHGPWHMAHPGTMGRGPVTLFCPLLW